ncbi:T9SS type A sorting domain-containing protein [Aquimarina sp. RZ0]|uniref:T9SS type A sorting domain-containing protein n=1 Tax=Aquimarina sp. RZ0 TaxID=2607730 RepID=UPI00165FFC1E|nr:T9SS type A sorting domain-containing protein [Aquimarina sp. RZ0]
MKIYIKLSWLFLVFACCYQIHGQIPIQIEPDIFPIPDTEDIDIASFDRPDFKGNQSVRGIVRISPDDTDFVLTRTGITLSLVPPKKNNKEQLWWLLQDYIHKGFSIVSVSDGTQWLFVGSKDSDTYQLELKTNDKTASNEIIDEYIDPGYFFEMQIPYTTQQKRHALIRSISNTDIYWHYTTSGIALNKLTKEDTTPFVFNYEIANFFENSYLSIPFYDSANHTENILQDKTATRISVVGEEINPDNNSAIIGSGAITVLNKKGDDEMFRVVFENESIASIGLLDYVNSHYTKDAIQSSGSRKLIAGISVDDGGDIYLFNKGQVKYTGFETDKPILFGYKQGKLIAKQGDKTKEMTGVPTPILLNNNDGNISRLLAKIRNGSVQLSYIASAIVISGKEFGTKELPDTYSTSPQFSHAPDPNKPSNLFDWQQEDYILRYKSNGAVITESVTSPFYEDNPRFSAIASKQSANGTYLGGEDFSVLDGWELIKMDFGYDENNKPKPDSKLRGEPYMMFYNRFTGKLRIFIYINNSSIANNLRVTLIDKVSNTISGTYGKPRLWSSFLQGKALDERTLSSGAYSKTVVLNSSSTGQFFYADFTFNYDPCICFFESNLQIKVDKVTKGDLQIVGKTLGGSIPAGSPVYDDFMAQTDNFLTGVLDAPFGEQVQTLGDISFNNFDEWGNREWSNETEFILPGKKVEQWEREALQLQYQGTVTMSSGDFLSATGKAMKAVGEGTDWGFLNTGAPLKAVGEGIDASGTAMKGSGRALTAKALKIRLDNLTDQPDKTIPLSFPDPQPSVVFSELAATGTLTISTNILNDVIITTPGSINAEEAPIEFGNGSKGSFPLYNEPLGIFNLLFTPEVGITVVENQYDTLGANLRLKEKPYVTTNIDQVTGFETGFFTASYVVTTYNREGVSTDSRRSRMFIIPTNDNQDIKELPTDFNITTLLDTTTMLENIKAYTGKADELKNELKKWIIVNLEVEYYGFSGVGESGQQNGEILRQSYSVNTDFHFDTVSGFNLNDQASSIGASIFDEYNGKNNPIWNDDYIITKDTDGFETHMKTFCEETVPNISVGSRSILQNKTRTDQDNIASDSREEQLKTEVEATGIAAYPNPSKRTFNVRYKTLHEGEVTMTVTDLNGRIILSHSDYVYKKGIEKEAYINLLDLNGVYILTIQFENGLSHITKLIKN